MKFKHLDLSRFGHFTDQKLNFASGETDFHIIYGPNEKGKSTIRDGVSDLLFGIGNKTKYNFIHENKQMRIGANLLGNSSEFEFIRRKGAKDTIIHEGGEAILGGEEKLRAILGGIDREFFERMFCLDHETLERGGQAFLSDEGNAGDAIFSAGAGLNGLSEILTKLELSAGNLWGPRLKSERVYSKGEFLFKEGKTELNEQLVSVSNWKKLKKEYEQVKQENISLEEKLALGSAELKKLSRIRRVFGLIHEKNTLRTNIENIEIKGLVQLPENSAELLEKAQKVERENASEITLWEKEKEAFEVELGTFKIDRNVIDNSPEIEALGTKQVEIRSAISDLPRREAEYAAGERDLKEWMSSAKFIKMNADDVLQFLPSLNGLNELRSLSQHYDEITNNIERSKKTLQQLSSDHERLIDEKEALPKIKDTTGLSAAIMAARGRIEILGDIKNIKANISEMEISVKRLVAEMQPTVGEIDQLVEYTPPSQIEIARFVDVKNSFNQKKNDLNRDFENAELERGDIEEAISRIRNIENIETQEELNKAREERNQIWSAVSREYIESDPISTSEMGKIDPNAIGLKALYERSGEKADAIADNRFSHAEEAAKLSELERRLENGNLKTVRLKSNREDLDSDHKKQEADYLALWSGAPVAPRDPEVMLNWYKARILIVERVDQISLANKYLEEKEAEEAELIESLHKHLGEKDVHGLRATLENAELIKSNMDTVTQELKAVNAGLLSTEERLKTVGFEIERYENELSAWKVDWAGNCKSIGISEPKKMNAVSNVLDMMSRIREKGKDLLDLKINRIQKIQLDIAAYEKFAVGVLQKLAPDLVDHSLDEANAILAKRTSYAQAQLVSYEACHHRIQETNEKIRLSEEKKRNATLEIEHLFSMAESKSSEELRTAIETSDLYRAFMKKEEDVDIAIRKEGDGFPYETLKLECAVVDIDQIPGQAEQVERDNDHVRRQILDRAERYSEAHRAFSDVGGDDRAAMAESKRQEGLTVMEEAAGQYIQTKLAAILLKWGLDRFREKNKAPMLKRAGEIFSQVTARSFDRLGIDYDSRDIAHIVGVRENGDKVNVGGMSAGSADQLYFSMRIAAIEDYLMKAEKLPFIADDLFINFDDARSLEGLKILEKLSASTQVLFFTHSEHLSEVAKSEFGDRCNLICLS